MNDEAGTVRVTLTSDGMRIEVQGSQRLGRAQRNVESRSRAPALTLLASH